MSRNTKIVVGIIAGIVGICCILAAVAAFLLPRLAEDIAVGADDPVAAAELARSIVDYDLPSGYEEQGAMNLLVFQMAFITNANSNAAIMIAEFSDALAGDEEEMQQQMQDAFANQAGSQNASLEFIGSEGITINGADATLATYEGTDNEGAGVRQIIGIFESKDGSPAMLMIFGRLDSWDEGGISRFLDSLE